MEGRGSVYNSCKGVGGANKLQYDRKNKRVFFADYCPCNPKMFNCTCTQNSARILEQSMGARNRVGIGLSYWPARLHRLAESVPWNRFLGSLKVKKFGRGKIFSQICHCRGIGTRGYFCLALHITIFTS